MANKPTELPIVERCVQQAKDQGRSKEEAIAICVKTLQQAGRIKKQDGEWVQVKRQQKTQRQPRRQRSR